MYRRPRKIWGVGLNYADHAGDLDEAAPAEEPASFMRPDTTIIGREAKNISEDGLGYWLGDERLRRFIKQFGRFLLLKESDFDHAQHWFDDHGGKAVMIGRVVPGMRKIVPIPAGVARMPVLRFMAYVSLTNGLANTLLVGLGWLLGDQWMAIRRYAHLLEYGGWPC